MSSIYGKQTPFIDLKTIVKLRKDRKGVKTGLR